jgi:hypothetical protein
VPTLIVIEDRAYGLAERLNLAESGKKFVCSFIEPGIVDYRDSGGGVELVKRETIAAALQSFVGNPLTLGHVARKNLKDRGVAQGFVDKARWNGETGWFDCEGTVSTDEARKRIKDGQRPSCGYTVLEYGPGGIWHNIPYDAEITKLQFHHLAIVENPRYEAADIRLNSKPAPSMFKLFLKKIGLGATEPTITEHTLPADQQVEVDGKPVKLNSLAAAWKAKTVADAKAAEVAAAALDPEKINKVGEDDEVEIDGKRVKMNELVTCYRQYGQKENEKSGNEDSSEEAKKARENAAIAEEAKLKENALKVKADADKAAADKAAADAAAAKERENAAGKASFALLAQAATLPPAAPTERANSSGSMAEGMKLGQSRYGTPGRN